MKRREFARAFLVSLVCGPALAADPLPALKETSMFADQVKVGRTAAGRPSAFRCSPG